MKQEETVLLLMIIIEMLNTNMTRTVIIIVWRCNDDYDDEYSAMHAILFFIASEDEHLTH